MNRRVSVLIFLLAFSRCTVFAAEKPWTEIRSPHFRIVTNGSIPDARKVATEFEELRWVFATRFPGARLESGAPLLVFAARDQETARSLEPAAWKRMGERVAGVFHHGWEKQFATVRLDTWGGEGSKEVVYHEYTHSILHMNSHWLPLWLDEGTAEFYAYTRFEQHRIYLGAPTERYRALRGMTPMSVETFISHHSPTGSDEQLFYAQAWALVHFLTFGPGMENGKRMVQFFSLLQQGVPQKRAFEDAFGDFKAVDRGLTAYMKQPTFAATILKDPPQFDDKSFTTRIMSVAETEGELGGFHLWMHHHETARGLLEQALRDDPKLGFAHENMGFLDFAEGKDAEAAGEFSQAYALDNNLYLSRFAKTMLSPLSTSTAIPDMNSFGAALGKVLQVNPQFAPAYAQLARLALRENDFDSAVLLSRKAEEMEPSLAGYHLLSGQILRRMGKGSDAADAAKFVADRWVGPDHNEAVELWNSVPTDQRPAGEVISEDAPKDTQLIEGKVKSITCADKDEDFSFVLDRDDRLFTFHRKGGFTTGFSDTIWYGGDHFSLCHHLEGFRAIVHYHPPSDTTYAGDIAEIEIRDDLPAPLTQASFPARP